MNKKPKLYIGLDTQELKWNLVCGTTEEPIWIDKIPDYEASSLKKTLEFARCKSGFEYEGYEPVLLFEDVSWGGSIAEFFQDNGVTVHILDETSVPSDLCEDISEEGFYSAETLYKILIRKFVEKKRTAMRTLDAEHGFARDIDILRRERKQQAFNSTMDLFSNNIGLGIIHRTVLGNPDETAIQNDVINCFTNGELYIWDGTGTAWQSEGILNWSDGNKIH